MDDQLDQIEVASSFTVARPRSQAAILVPTFLWNQWVRRLKKKPPRAIGLLSGLGWSLVGLAGAAFLSLLVLPPSAAKELPDAGLWLITTFVAGSVLALVCLVVSWALEQQQTSAAEDIIAEMQQLRGEDASATPASPPGAARPALPPASTASTP